MVVGVGLAGGKGWRGGVFGGAVDLQKFAVEFGEGGGEGGEAADQIVDFRGWFGPVDAAGFGENFWGMVEIGRVLLRGTCKGAGDKAGDGVDEKSGADLFHPVMDFAGGFIGADRESLLEQDVAGVDVVL